ncbi:ribonuclease HII [Candidatus Pacearchaeota archaeon CG10_big_fil_rev_8_21_14_0_10_34_12]|nr:MAG: ribonuclease HII [Candidatus Pacearchaeota archaeon CG10_big_fil_rev_8_21_14_0_10_34_12]
MLKLGIDDAGRGPVIGPMVLAGCLIDEETQKEFKRLGVKDSKQLTPKRREFLADVIREKAETFEVIVVYPDEIENHNKNGVKLNEVEAFACARIINKINKGYKEMSIVLDCPSTSLVKWKEFLVSNITNLKGLEISCEHKADRNHICVSAASILAKSVREKEMLKLKEKYGSEIGSGYSSDPVTSRFVAKNVRKLNNHGIFRKTWSTWKNAMAVQEQKKIGDF